MALAELTWAGQSVAPFQGTREPLTLLAAHYRKTEEGIAKSGKRPKMQVLLALADVPEE
jgi:hypothetical protein